MKRKIPCFVLTLFLLQPIMDTISFWFTQLGLSNTLTLGLRLAVLAVSGLFGFCLSKRKRVYFIAAAVMLLLGAGHVHALYDYGAPASIISDLTNYIRVLQLPILTLCLITFLEANDGTYAMMKWGMAGSLAIILLVTVLASLTGTEPHTYVDGKGYIGWFNTTNAQSSILSMVVPVAVLLAYEKKGVKSIWFWAAAILGLGALFLLGTRLGLLAIVAVGFGMGICRVLICPRLWRHGICFSLAAVLFLLLLPWSPMNTHQGTFDNVQSNRQAVVDADLRAHGLDPEGHPETAAEKILWREALHDTYYYHAYDFVKIFGMEQTMEHYGYTADVAQLTAQRPKKLMFGRLLVENSPASAKLFGVELQRFTVGQNNYDVENDLHGIRFLYGSVGLCLLLLFVAYFLLRIIKALIKDAEYYFTLDAAAWGISLVCCLLHVYHTAGVLRRPNASFYMAAVLAAVYYLTKPKRETR